MLCKCECERRNTIWRLALVARGGVGDSGAAMEVTRKYDGRRYGGVTEGDMEV